MRNRLRNICILSVALLVLGGCGQEVQQNQTTSLTGNVAIVSTGKEYAEAHVIDLQVDKGTIDGEAIEEYDYTWHCDPGTVHDEVKNAPAEYYTGTKPETEAKVYVDHELYYYPLLDSNEFKKVNYDGEQEWAYYYKDGENNDYIFATLPVLGNALPTQMMHSEDEAAENKVLHITEAGTYVLRGSWKGQVKVDISGEDIFTNPEGVVTIILDGADIECTVAPGLMFANVYECDNAWEEAERTDATVDTTGAGAVIVLADDSENYISGTNVFRMLKTKYSDENSTDEVKKQKKMRKTDGALYSYMTMNINGEEKGNGKLQVDAGFEGIDSELHLSVNGGDITVNSEDDGMNVNEDHVSVIAFRGGQVTINAALGAEGDGVDSNGFIAVDGGTILVNGIRVPDSALDSEDGIYYNGGSIIIDGEEQNYEKGSVFRETDRGGFGIPDMGNRDFEGKGQGFREFAPGMEARDNFDIKAFKEQVAKLGEDATYEDILRLLGLEGMGMRGEQMPEPPMEK